MPRGVKPTALAGVAEIDETYVLESSKGQRVAGRKARERGGSAIGARRIHNVNSDNGPVKRWLLCFNGDATSYLENDLGWFRGHGADAS